MAILQMAGLAKYWGAETLFKDVDLLVNEGEKVALVGRNGTGKTTLLRLVLGRVEPDAGTVTLSPDCRVGYLSQDPEFVAGRTVFEEAQTVFTHLGRWEEELRVLERQMGTSREEAELAGLMERYARLSARY